MSNKNQEIETRTMSPNVIVLLIDDEPKYAEQIRNLLTPEKELSFHYCQDPGIALRMIEQKKPTILLIDHFMPKMDSFRLIHSIREVKDYEKIPIIFLLSKTDDTLKLKAIEIGVKEVIIKIPERNDFVNKIRNHSDEYNSHNKIVKNHEVK